jgi:hypothetical protein
MSGVLPLIPVKNVGCRRFFIGKWVIKVIEKGFEKQFDYAKGSRRCGCGNKVWAFSQFHKLPVITCTHCGATTEHGTNNIINTSGYKLTKKDLNDLFWQHVWVVSNA